MLYATPSSVLNAVVTRLPVLLLPVFFGLEVVGYFGRAFVALAVPLSLIGTAVAQVFFAHAAEAARTGSLSSLTDTVHARLVMMGLFPTLVLVAAGPDLFEFVFGDEWRVAGSYARYLAGWFFLSGVASPLTRLFDVLERQRAELLISLATSAALTLALVLGGRSGSALVTMALIAAAGGTVRVMQIAIMLRMAGVSPRRALRPYGLYAVVSTPLILPILLAAGRLPAWATTAVAAGAGLVYALLSAWRVLAEPAVEGNRQTP